MLVVCNDENLVEKIRLNKDKFSNLYFTNFDCFLNFYLNCNTNLDVVIIDLDPLFENKEEINFSNISLISPNQKFIFLAKNKKVYSKILKNFHGGSSALLFKPIKTSVLLDSIAILSPGREISFLRLNKEVKINLEKEQIYKNNEQIFLTNLQHKLILLLAQNVNNLTTFSMIEEVVYHDKMSSKIAMQNLVGVLKRNLNLDIKNVHSKGYILYSY